MKRFLIGIAGLTFWALPGTAHPGQDLWLHVAVDGGRRDAERVRVNVPLRLVSAVLPLIDQEELHRGRLHLDDLVVRTEDLAEILRAIAEVKEGELVTVENRREVIRVTKQGDLLIATVEERGGDESETVDVKVPVQVLRALVSSGDDGSLDLIAAVDALGKHARGDIVSVNDRDGTSVRVWIDESNESD